MKIKKIPISDGLKWEQSNKPSDLKDVPQSQGILHRYDLTGLRLSTEILFETFPRTKSMTRVTCYKTEGNEKLQYQFNLPSDIVTPPYMDYDVRKIKGFAFLLPYSMWNIDLISFLQLADAGDGAEVIWYPDYVFTDFNPAIHCDVLKLALLKSRENGNYDNLALYFTIGIHLATDTQSRMVEFKNED